ncbi:Integrator 12 [Carabus blaptoides fortunei]
MDSCFVRAIRYLHSTSSDSLNNLRVLLDEAIKNKYGTSKDLGSFGFYPSNLQDFSVFPGNVSSTDNVSSKDECQGGSGSDNELELDLLKEDLMCIICKGMGVGARNRLVECGDCHNLYHQECHDPTISDEEIESSDAWNCATCKDVQASKSVKKFVVTPSSSSSSSQKNSSSQISVQSKLYIDKDFSEASSTKSHGSSSSSNKYSSSGQNRVLTPNINIISADKRLQIMKKKAAKLQEKRKLSR